MVGLLAAMAVAKAQSGKCLPWPLPWIVILVMRQDSRTAGELAQHKAHRSSWSPKIHDLNLIHFLKVDGQWSFMVILIGQAPGQTEHRNE